MNSIYFSLFFALGVSSSLFAQSNQLSTKNTIYEQLRKTGIAFEGEETIPLPEPLLADGLDLSKQRSIIDKLLGDDYTSEDWLRNSIVAPFILQIKKIDLKKRKSPVQSLDLYFVLHASLDEGAIEDWLNPMGEPDRASGKKHRLTLEELALRKMSVPKDLQKSEGYGHAVFPLLDKVEISVTGRSFWSRTDDSILVASLVDDRFLKDRDFPNRWRTMDKQGEKTDYGPYQPYRGAGGYLKATKLYEPKGAVFVECHLLFDEPEGWFQGENYLRSKLPAAAQKIIRDLRREIAKKKK